KKRQKNTKQEKMDKNLLGIPVALFSVTKKTISQKFYFVNSLMVYNGIWKYKKTRKFLSPRIFFSSFESFLSLVSKQKATFVYKLVEESRLISDLKESFAPNSVDEEIVSKSYFGLGVEIAETILRSQNNIRSFYRHLSNMFLPNLGYDSLRYLIYGVQEALQETENIPRMFIHSKSKISEPGVCKIVNSAGGEIFEFVEFGVLVNKLLSNKEFDNKINLVITN
ncbi:hypothetical protein D6810_00095, partial [Candidatus Dojkabacteria bacterium]